MLGLDKSKGRSKGVEEEVEATGLSPFRRETIAFRASMALGLTVRGFLERVGAGLTRGPKGFSRTLGIATLGGNWEEVEGTAAADAFLGAAEGSGVEGIWTWGQEQELLTQQLVEVP